MPSDMAQNAILAKARAMYGKCLSDSDYKQLAAWIAKTYTLKRDVENQCTEVSPGYFGVEFKEED